MQRAIVTGGGGFVGQAIVRLLLSRGIKTAVIGRSRYPELAGCGVDLYQGDIRDRQFLTTVCRGADAIFHVAAKAGVWGSRSEYYSINVTGTENVLAACRHNRIPHLVYTSTPSVVFNSGDLEGVDESAPYAENFLCHYAETKMLAEKAVLAANCPALKTTALRPHLVFGPGDPNLIPRLVDRGRRNLLKRVGTGKNRVDISYIDNVAEAHLLAAESLASAGAAAGRTYFVSQGEPVNLWDWINDFFRMIDLPPVTKAVSFRKAWLAGALLEKTYHLLRIRQEPPMTRFVAEQLARSHWFSIEAARRDLKYKARISTEEGMKRTAAWINEQGGG